MKKKLLSLVLTIVLLLSTIPVSLTTNAATLSETESNDDYSSANTFSLNSTISGKMSSYDDVDFFKITPTKNGKIALTFNNTYSDSSIYWRVRMICYQGGSYTEFYNETIYANSGETRALPSIGASSGNIYYISVSTSSYYNTTGINYNINNVFTATEYYEKEIDNAYATATSMTFNQTYGGVMNNYGDVDYYKFSPSQNGKIALTFNNTYKDASVYWNIRMYCYQGGSYTEFYNETIYANSGETRALPSIGAVSGSVYYIVISTSDYYNSIGLDYSIKNVFTATEYYEKEIDNSYSAATSMAFNQTYGGVMNNYGDVDYYKFSPSQNGKIALTFNNTYKDASVYWNIKMYCYQGGSYTEFYNETIYANSGETRALPSIGAVSGSIYYIVISTSDYYNSIGLDYSIKNVFTATEYYEKEINNAYSTATVISANQTYGGVMNNYGDSDYYKISLSQSSMPFYFTHESINSSSTYWSIKILKYNSGTYDEVFSKTLYMNDTAGQLTTITSSGTYYICISTSSYYNTTGCEYNILIGTPDTTKPSGTITSTNNVASSQTITLTMSDNVGLAGYYWGTSSSISPNFTSISGKSYTATIRDYSTIGTSYLTVKDTSGNIYQTTKTFYKTTLNANGGSVTPTSVFTMSGNNFTLPTPTKNGSTYNGWSTSSTATSGVKTLTPIISMTYYAVWTPDPSDTTKPSASVSSSNNVASSQTITIDISDDVGLAGYYWGISSSISPTFTNISGKNYSTTVSVSSNGIYYLTVKDTSGNIYQTTKTFYKTTLNANGGSVTPTSILTMSGNSFTFPTPTYSGKTYNGWSTSSSATSGVKTLAPTSNTTYYAVWTPTPTPSTLIKASSVKGTAGNTVDVTISLSNNPGIVAMTLKVSYNSSVLALKDVKDAGVLGSNSHKPEKTSPYTLSWANDTATSNYTVNGTIATLTFEIKDGAAVGNYPITVNYDYNNYGIYDKDLNKVNFNIENGIVEVIDVVYGDVDGNGIVNNLDRVYLTRYLANWNDYQNIDLTAADVDCNGTVNNLDRVILTRYLANWSAYSELPHTN